MCIAGVQVILSICNYTFDASPPDNKPLPMEKKMMESEEEELQPLADEEKAASKHG
jgi:hypothetical protein